MTITNFPTLEEYCAARPATWKFPAQPQLDIEKLKVAAHHLLGRHGKPGGYMPGSFTTALIRAWELADRDNTAKLASQWPELGSVMDIVHRGSWEEALVRITEGEAP